MIVCFAYGSNMLSRRLLARAPSARAIGPAMLRSHQLRWHKVSGDRSGKCDVVASSAPDATVFGVLFAVSAADKPRLDAAEGLGAGYAERQIVVETLAGHMLARLYYATHTDAALVPYTWYRSLVVAGARENCLPADYTASIEATSATQDRDIGRHARNIALAPAG